MEVLRGAGSSWERSGDKLYDPRLCARSVVRTAPAERLSLTNLRSAASSPIAAQMLHQDAVVAFAMVAITMGIRASGLVSGPKGGTKT